MPTIVAATILVALILAATLLGPRQQSGMQFTLRLLTGTARALPHGTFVLAR